MQRVCVCVCKSACKHSNFIIIIMKNSIGGLR